MVDGGCDLVGIYAMMVVRDRDKCKEIFITNMLEEHNVFNKHYENSCIEITDVGKGQISELRCS